MKFLLFFVGLSVAHLCMLSPMQRGPLVDVNKEATSGCGLAPVFGFSGPCGNNIASTPHIRIQTGFNFSVVFQKVYSNCLSLLFCCLRFLPSKNEDHFFPQSPGYFELAVFVSGARTRLLTIPDTATSWSYIYESAVVVPSLLKGNEMVLWWKQILISKCFKEMWPRSKRCILQTIRRLKTPLSFSVLTLFLNKKKAKCFLFHNSIPRNALEKTWSRFRVLGLNGCTIRLCGYLPFPCVHNQQRFFFKQYIFCIFHLPLLVFFHFFQLFFFLLLFLFVYSLSKNEISSIPFSPLKTKKRCSLAETNLAFKLRLSKP
jgi:hypothetical protein